jgi:hypothetical protein
MTTYNVRIFDTAKPSDSHVIEIQQPDRTNLALSPEIPPGWAFQNASEKPKGK